MTRMMSAHSIWSVSSLTSAPLFSPAESVWIFGRSAKMCSAVGLLHLLSEQINSKFFI